VLQRGEEELKSSQQAGVVHDYSACNLGRSVASRSPEWGQ
jgi:hypothetical protein